MASSWSNAVRPALRALGGRLGGGWERERRDTLLLMGAIALSVLPQLGGLPWWCSTGFGMLFLWRLGLTLSGRWMPRASVRWAASAACVLAVWAQYGTLLGREPGVALLVLFLGLKLMEMRARRDAYVVIFLCFFLLLTSFFRSQSALVALGVVIALAALVASMTTMQFGAREQPLSRRFAASAALLAQAAPLALVLFFLFPRLPGPLWGLPQDEVTGRSGLSDTMAPGSVQRLALSDEIAFRVAFDGEAPAPAQLYWRGPTLGIYDGRTWRGGQDAVVPPPSPEVSADEDTPRVTYTVTMEATGRSELYPLEAPARLPVVADRRIGITPAFDLLVQPPVLERLRWQGIALMEYRIGMNETPMSLRGWMQLPAGFNRQTFEMAGRWRAEEQDDADRLVARALAMFRTQPFRYTLEPPPLSRDGVDDFLFRTRAGFCEHYASAFVVLMRAMDIPARVVTGYQGGERNPVDGYWVVRQADAHAWTEVWLAGRGWVRVDPTAAIAPERIERGTRAARPQAARLPLGDGTAFGVDWRLRLEAVANAWNQWVLSYDRSRQLALLARLGLPVQDWIELAGLMALALATGIAAVALVTLHPRKAPDPLERCWQRFCDRLEHAGVDRAPHETPSTLLARAERLLPTPAQRAQARAIVSEYNTLRYDVASPPSPAVRRLARLVDAFQP